ncbi:asparagine synthase (glutamine-hydrolyzing) [Prochlorococcus sp. MIT 1011]|uniref:asparagine synthase (glutamine-hydrolyzing) n=1 Tax=Prochlorococcus sp. MIT 1011 TaxID=3082520 RepID=UPI0039B4ED75
MCGFFGIYNKSNDSDSSFLDKFFKSEISQLLIHRGPDGCHWYEDNNIKLASVRLKITGRRNDSDMPYHSNSEQNIIGFNGEIYNFRKLANKFSYEIKTDCDTEVVTELIEKFGHNVCNQFEGIFAIANYNKNEKKLSLIRDPIGVKPIYYFQNKDFLIFSSEIKPILFTCKKLGISIVPSYRASIEYISLSKYDHSELTFFEGIYKVQPGMIISQLGNSTFKSIYYDYSYEENKDTFEEVSREFLFKLTESMKIQTQTDLPINVAISGGNDSRIMLSTLAKCGTISNVENSWSYSYQDHLDNDLSNINNITSFYNLKHNIVTLQKNDFINDFDEILLALEQPFPGLPTIAKYNMYKKASIKSNRIFLEGQGGDEIGGGYRYTLGAFVKYSLNEDIDFDFNQFVEQYSLINNLNKNQIYKLIINSQSKLFGLNSSADGTSIINEKFRMSMENIQKKDSFESDYFFNAKSTNEFQKVLDDDLFMNKLQRVLRSCDICSMSFSKELRVPILAPSLVKFARSIIPKHKVHNGLPRGFFMNALKMVENPKIHSSSLVKKHVVDPQREWLFKDLKEFVLSTIDENKLSENLGLEKKQIKLLINDFYNQESTPNNSVLIWQLLCLSKWYELFF